MKEITYDEVYEIAAEVCEEMITKFLKNLVKLLPKGEDVVDEIQEQQYEELKAFRQEKLRESINKRQRKQESTSLPGGDEFGLLGDDFNSISHPDSVVGEGEENSWAEKNDMDAALNSLGNLPPMGNIGA